MYSNNDNSWGKKNKFQAYRFPHAHVWACSLAMHKFHWFQPFYIFLWIIILCRNILRVISNEKTVGNSRFQKLHLLLTLSLYIPTYIWFDLWCKVPNEKEDNTQKCQIAPIFLVSLKSFASLISSKSTSWTLKAIFTSISPPKVLSFIIFSPSELPYN